MIKLVQYGLPRSGTTFIRYMIERNLIDVSVDGTHKHNHASNSEIDYLRGFDAVLLCAKNPYAWMDSMARWGTSRNNRSKQWYL